MVVVVVVVGGGGGGFGTTRGLLDSPWEFADFYASFNFRCVLTHFHDFFSLCAVHHFQVPIAFFSCRRISKMFISM